MREQPLSQQVARGYLTTLDNDSRRTPQGRTRIPSREPFHHPDAACLNYDPDAWYDHEDSEMTQNAIGVCRQECPIQQECLDWALDHDERDGVWGGMTEKQRRRLKRRLERGVSERLVSEAV